MSSDLIPQSIKSGLERLQQFYDGRVDSWEDFVKRFVLYGSGWSATTYENTLSAVRTFFDKWSRTQNQEGMMLHPAEITPAHIELFFDWYAKQRKVQSAVVKVREVKAFFRRLEEKFPFFLSPFGSLNETLIKKLAGPSRDKRLQKVPTMAEVEKICEFLLAKEDLQHFYAYCVLRLMVRHGFRVGEVVQLRWDGIEQVGSLKAIDFIAKGNRASQQILDEEVLKDLKRLRRAMNYDGPKLLPLPPNRHYHRIKNPCRQLAPGDIEYVFVDIEEMVKTNNLMDWQCHWHPHLARHILGTHMSMKGFPIQTIAKVLRHKDISVTADFYDKAPPPPPEVYL